jgi:hypothetical protein
VAVQKAVLPERESRESYDFGAKHSLASRKSCRDRLERRLDGASLRPHATWRLLPRAPLGRTDDRSVPRPLAWGEEPAEARKAPSDEQAWPPVRHRTSHGGVSDKRVRITRGGASRNAGYKGDPERIDVRGRSVRQQSHGLGEAGGQIAETVRSRSASSRAERCRLCALAVESTRPVTRPVRRLTDPGDRGRSRRRCGFWTGRNVEAWS